MTDDRGTSPEDIRLVSRYLTPYSLILVVTGLILRFFEPMESIPAIWILLATVVVNIGVKTQGEWLPFRTPAWFTDWRVGVNLAADLLLIYLLMPHWPEVWLLLLVMAIAIAVYDSLDKTLFHCCTFGCVLLLFTWLNGMAQDYRLGQMLMYGTTVVFIGLFVNRLVNVLSPALEKRGEVKVAANPDDLPEKMLLVSRLMTPFAAFLVLMGLVFGHPPVVESRWVIGILAITVFVNFSSMIRVGQDRRQAPMLRKLRMAVNVVSDLWLIWILLPYWPEAWLLLLLMVVAQGVYGTRRTTLLWGFGCAVALFVIAAMRRMTNVFWMAEAMIYGVTYIFISLFVNRLVFLLKEGALPMSATHAKTSV